MTVSPLEAGNRRNVRAKHATNARRFRRIRRARAVAVRHDPADLRRRESRGGERLSDRARDTVAVGTDVSDSRRFAHTTGTEKLAENFRAAFTRCGFRFEKHRGRALAEHRSEEHTSELQSRLHLVCRLLLEK